MKVKLLVVNSMVTELEESLKKEFMRWASPGTKIEFTALDEGAPAKVGLQMRYFLNQTEYFILKKIKERQQEYDAIIVSCGLDPAVGSGREISKIPIVVPTEASVLAVDGKFAILCACKEGVPIYKENILRYGLAHKMVSVRPIGIPCDDIGKDPELTKAAMIQQAAEAVIEDGAQVIVPGFVTPLAAEVENAVNVPVVSPVKAAVKRAEMMCATTRSKT